MTDQNIVFKGRTSLFPNELTNGNGSLLLSNVQLSDIGTYKCTITNSQGTGSNTLYLNVGGEAIRTKMWEGRERTRKLGLLGEDEKER